MDQIPEQPKAQRAKRGLYIYMVTIKNNSDVYTSKSTLDEALSKLKEELKGADWSAPAYELDSLLRLHLHILVYVPKVPWLKKIYSLCRPLHVHFQKIDNPMGAIKYMQKTQGYKDEVAREYQLVSYCHYHKLF